MLPLQFWCVMLSGCVENDAEQSFYRMAWGNSGMLHTSPGSLSGDTSDEFLPRLYLWSELFKKCTTIFQKHGSKASGDIGSKQEVSTWVLRQTERRSTCNFSFGPWSCHTRPRLNASNTYYTNNGCSYSKVSEEVNAYSSWNFIYN